MTAVVYSDRNIDERIQCFLEVHQASCSRLALRRSLAHSRRDRSDYGPISGRSGVLFSLQYSNGVKVPGRSSSGRFDMHDALSPVGGTLRTMGAAEIRFLFGRESIRIRSKQYHTFRAVLNIIQHSMFKAGSARRSLHTLEWIK